MINIFKTLFVDQRPKVAVASAPAPSVKEDTDVLIKQIHDEVDALEEQSVKAVEQMLAELQIPTVGKIENKAKLMQSLGFSSSNEVVKNFETIKKDIAEKESIQANNKAKLELINEYRLAYPTDKIIPMSEFLKVLQKYNLIYAPAKAYIKDVPEKNLLDIKNAKSTKVEHEALDIHYITDVQTRDYYNNRPELIASLHKYFSETRYLKYLNTDNYRGYAIESHHDYIERLSKELYNNKYDLSEYIRDINSCRVTRDKLYISAPKNHFDLSNLSGYSDGRGFYEMQKPKLSHIPDPIAFYLLRGIDGEEFVRIVSKWGTSDDQSYLDPIVQDERMN